MLILRSSGTTWRSYVTMTDEEVWRAINELAEAVEEQNERLRTRNAVLAVLAMNHESQHRERRNEEPPTSYSYTWSRFAADVQDALTTLEEDLDK